MTAAKTDFKRTLDFYAAYGLKLPSRRELGRDYAPVSRSEVAMPVALSRRTNSSMSSSNDRVSCEPGTSFERDQASVIAPHE